MTTLEELEQATRKAKNLVKEIKDITEILSTWELTLMDIVANEEQLKDTCDQLQEEARRIISLRQWLDFEQAKPL